jgi:GNAT superfamily N-acetyltransferase
MRDRVGYRTRRRVSLRCLSRGRWAFRLDPALEGSRGADTPFDKGSEIPLHACMSLWRGGLWVRDGDTTPPVPVVPRVNAVFGEVRRAAAGALLVVMGLEDPAVVLRRFDAGCRCFAAWIDGTIVAYGWVSEGVQRIGELDRLFRLPSGDAYIWDCATLPPFRRQRLYSALLGYIVSVSRDKGTQRLWIAVAHYNRASKRGIAAAGFQPVMHLSHVRIFDRGHIWVAGYRRAPPSLVAQARRGLMASVSAVEDVKGRVEMVD